MSTEEAILLLEHICYDDFNLLDHQIKGRLEAIEVILKENQDLKNQLSNGHQIKNQQKEIINIIENKFLESTLESYVCIKIEDYLKLKNILYR